MDDSPTGMKLGQALCLVSLGVLLGGTIWLGWSDHVLRAFWPSFLALVLVVLFRSAFWGLLAGAVAGAWLIGSGVVLVYFQLSVSFALRRN